MDIDVLRGTARMRPPAPLAGGGAAPGLSFALLGANEIAVALTPAGRTPAGPDRDDLAFDAVVTNRLVSVALVTPTFPAPPLTPGIFLAPFAATVTGGAGNVRANAATWGTANPPDSPERWNFFNDHGCPAGSNDCLVWATLPTLPAGATSPARRISFLIDRGVTAVTVYFIVAADVGEPPGGPGHGAIAGVLTGDDLGALAGVTVRLDGANAVVTDANGYFGWGGVDAGAHTVTFANAPAACATAPRTVSVTAGDLAIVHEQLLCYGGVAGVVASGAGPLSGVTVEASASGEATLTTQTDAGGAFVFGTLRAVTWQLRILSGLPGACPLPPPVGVAVRAGQVVTQPLAAACTGALSGTVRDGATGLPIAGATVQVQPALGPPLTTTSSATGDYGFGAVPVGPAQVSVGGAPAWCGPLATSHTVAGGVNALDLQVPCAAPPSVAPQSLPPGTIGSPYLYDMVGGPPGIAWSVNTLPGGLVLNSGSGRLSGTPQAPFDGPVSVTATDPFGRSAQVTLQLLVTGITPDPWEPNDVLSAARDFGTINNAIGTTWTGWFHTLLDRDFFRVTVTPPLVPCTPGTIITRSATVRLTLPGSGVGDYDLYVFDLNGAVAGSSQTRAVTGTEQVTVPVSWTCGQGGSRVGIIEVRRFSGAPTTARYTVQAALAP